MGNVDVLENKRPVLGINSLGRIGKLSLWHHVGRKYFQEIIVNIGRESGTGLSSVAQFIEKDVTYGTIHKFLYGINSGRIIQIVDEKKGKLLIDGIPVTILREARNPVDIGWRNYGVDLVVECTGKFRDPTLAPEDPKGSIKGHLASGAKVVINSSAFKIKNKSLSAPSDTVTLIYGINHTAFNYKKHLIVSAASCTTTGLAHMVKPLLENAETSNILTASMSTVHAVTNTQSVLDNLPKAGEKDLRKNRSIFNNIILTSTNAAEALSQVIPEVKNIGFMADSIRVPINTESLIVLNATFQSQFNEDGTRTPVTTKTINDIYKKASEKDLEHLLIYSTEQNVSTDLIGMNAAIVIEGQFNHTRTAFIDVDVSRIPNIPAAIKTGASKNMLRIPVVHAKIFGWYDNEYGSYTNRMGDLAVYVHKSLR
ncbi:MAG TPA: glyceraldehyde 3-phosphate dehydrogenase NAD-binding domain-containing protein [Syntrophorhabdaceae bacterium]|nr:glyceraldehyde 3-phosphate dehydrogenase NAD-binding domain-containing protein [Syntrophorhabdaceae bacterium]HQM82735.1 glyceraldehyde 3-phosphate dehydrogenase NAD-binding domain-containing protein [Syntrophorhabdaceae bacterium]